MKILYVEDSPDQVAHLERIAHHLGHELVVATTGEQGYSLAQEQPDLVLLDINLPDTNGLDLARRLRAEHPIMPIVAITADVYLYDEVQALQAGCTAFISKPYSVETIKALFARFSQ